MAAGGAATVTAFIGCAALAKRSSIMTGDAEGGRSRTCHLLGIGCLVVVTVVISDIISIVGFCRMGGDIVIQV